MRKTTKKDEITATDVIGATNDALAPLSDSAVLDKYERYYKNNPEKPITSKIGIGISKSYENPAIAAARAKRGGVYMQQINEKGDAIGAPKHFTSMRYAYEIGLKVSLNGHIEFRGRVKKSSEPIKKTFEGVGTFLFSNAPVKLEEKGEEA